MIGDKRRPLEGNDRDNNKHGDRKKNASKTYPKDVTKLLFKEIKSIHILATFCFTWIVSYAAID